MRLLAIHLRKWPSPV